MSGRGTTRAVPQGDDSVMRVWVGALLLLLAGELLAENCTLTAHDLSALPPTRGGPVDVDINLYMSDLIEIRDSDQSFVSDVFFRAEWRDTRLAHSGQQPCYVDERDIWTPQLQLLNRRTKPYSNGDGQTPRARSAFLCF